MNKANNTGEWVSKIAPPLTLILVVAGLFVLTVPTFGWLLHILFYPIIWKSLSLWKWD